MTPHPTATVSPADAGMRLDHWLARRFTYQSRSQWQRAVIDRQVTVNRDAVKPSAILRAGDAVAYRPPARPEPPVDLQVTILHRDRDLIAVNKPGNLPCHPAGSYFRHTLWAWLEQHHLPTAIVNRLDRETSGIVLIAATRAAAAELGRQFAAHTVRKQYLVLVEGAFPDTLDTIGVLQPADGAVRKRRRFRSDTADGETAATRFVRLDCASGVSLVRATPATGRLHQIRATLQSLGYPVVGDKLYGRDEQLYLRFIDDRLSPADRQLLRMDRQALHAHQLRFAHPSDGDMVLTAPVPDDFSAALDALQLTPNPALDTSGQARHPNPPPPP